MAERHSRQEAPMDAVVIVIIVVLAVVLAVVLVAAGLVVVRRRSSAQLQERFGPEYERAVEERGGAPRPVPQRPARRPARQ